MSLVRGRESGRAGDGDGEVQGEICSAPMRPSRFRAQTRVTDDARLGITKPPRVSLPHGGGCRLEYFSRRVSSVVFL